jgi:cell division protein FtsI (penicillin-binding protein 3)
MGVLGESAGKTPAHSRRDAGAASERRMANASSKGGKRRLYVLAAVLGLWLLAIPVRLVHLQVVRYGEFTQRAARQQQRTIEVAPRRGILYDRNGNELAMSITVDSVFAVPHEIEQPAVTAARLAKVLNTDSKGIETRLRSARAFAWVARKVDAETSERIRTLNLKGIYFQKEPKRFYPKRELAAQTLGYVGMDDEGLGGLERAFDEQLRGKPGRMYITQDARRRWFGSVERQPEPGENVVLTLDEKIQYIAERELERAVKETKAEAGTVIVQNPRTGEILALANYPSFNPNRFRNVPAERMKNRAVSDIYEPGSTFKVVTLSAALEEKLTRPDEVFDCQMGAIVIHGRRIRDHKPFGMLTASEVLAHSSGVGAIKVALRLGEERFDKYIRAFGFGVQTGLELPGESRGYTRPAERWSKVSIGAIAMGQEIGVTPVQIASMISTVANDGVWTPPRLVAGTTKAGAPAQTLVFTPAEQRRVISPLTAVQMKQMMEGVVLFGTSRKAILNGYTSAGKSGTAQKADPTTGTYSRTKFVSSFAGFAPVRNPAVTVVVIIDSPVGERGGGKIAGPVFARVAQQVLAYLNVPHDVEPRSEQERLMRAAARTPDSEIQEGVPDRVGEGVAVADLAPETAPLAPVGHADAAEDVALLQALARERKAGTKAAERPAAAMPPPPSGGTVVVVDVEGGVEVPSFVGKPLRAAIELAQEAGVEIDVIGSGIAREQAPPPGARISAGSRVAVRFVR